MKNITATDIVADRPTAVALGIFDGVHLGHKAIFDKVKEYEKQGFSPAVFTFKTESISVKHGKKYNYIYTNNTKMKIFESMGVEYVYAPDFSQLKSLSCEEFIRDILVKKMNASAVVCGPKFRFGKGAKGGVDELLAMSKIYGFDVGYVEPVYIDNAVVSSSIVKEFLLASDIAGAERFLGHGYTIEGRVCQGNRIGRTIDFPTINQYFQESQLIPQYGVYSSVTYIDGREYLSVTNIGVKPTVDSSGIPLAETHILGYSGNLYDKEMTVRLTEYIRGECRFSSVDELKKQIKADVQKVKTTGGIK